MKTTGSGIGAIPLIAQNYIKYDRLTEMTNTVFAGSSATECVIAIDLYSMLSPLYSIYEESKDASEYDIAATIINMIAHYRKFFWTRYKVTTKFTLVYSDNCSRHNRMSYPRYNEGHSKNLVAKRYVWDKIISNLKLVELICPYISDTCYFSGDFDVSVLISHSIWAMRENSDKSKDIPPAIIITKDPIVMQSIVVTKSAVIYRPKKSKGIDSSYFVDKAGLYTHLFQDRDNVFPAALVGIELSPALYSLVLACTKVPERSMTALLSIRTAYQNIIKAIQTSNCLNDYNHNIFDIIETFDMKSREVLYTGDVNIGERFKAIDIIYQMSMFNNSPAKINYKGMMNLYDPNGIHQIAEQYFKVTTLNLESL